MVTSSVPSLTMSISSLPWVCGGCASWPGFTVVMWLSKLLSVSVGPLKTSRREPEAVGVTLSVLVSMTVETIFGRRDAVWAAGAGVAGDAAADSWVWATAAMTSVAAAMAMRIEFLCGDFMGFSLVESEWMNLSVAGF